MTSRVGGSTGLLVGRAAPVAMIEDFLLALAVGSGRAVLLRGEPGAGKTRLLDELADQAGERGFQVVWGRCFQVGEAEPYGLWRWVLRSLGVTVGAGANRDAWISSVIDALAAAAARTPIVLCLDDLQWADVASLELLHVVVAASANMPVLIAGARRAEPDGSSRADALIAGMPSTMLRMEVEPLDESQVGELVTELLGVRPADDVVSRVTRRTGGNPFFVREVAALFARSPTLLDSAIPVGVHDVLTARLNQLPGDCRTILELLSVFGQQARITDLVAVSGGSAAELRRDLGPAVRAGLVRVVPSWHRVEFSHGLIRDAVYGNLPPAAAADTHRRVAEVLDGAAAPGVVFWHWRLADGADAHRRAAACALAAAREAVAGLAFEQATRFYRSALDLGAGDVGVDELEIRLQLADTLTRSGEGGADDVWWEAATLARRMNRPAELARAAVGFGAGTGGFEVRGHDARQTGLLEEALTAQPDTPSGLRALLLARLSVSLGFDADHRRREELAMQAVSVASRCGDLNARVQALAALCDARSGPADVTVRAAASTTMLALARQAGDIEGQLLALRFAIVATLESGDFRAADGLVDAFERLAVRLRQPQHLWYPPMWRALRATMAGELTEAEHLLAEAERIGRDAHSQNAFLLALSQRMTLDREYGDVRRVAAIYAELLPGHIPAQARATLAAVYVDIGDLDRARATLNPLVLRRLTDLPVDSEWLSCLFSLTHAAVACGELTAARLLYDALLPHADRWVIDGIGASCWAVGAELLGRLSTLLGDHDNAEAWLGQALAAYQRPGALVLTSHALQAFAVLADARGDRTEAQTKTAAHRGLRRQLRLPDAATFPPWPPGRSHPPERAVAPAADSAPSFIRTGPVWAIGWRGKSGALPDAKGLQDLAALLGRPGDRVHVLDLAGPGSSASRSTPVMPVLDAAARTAYRRRLTQLEAAITDADDAGNSGAVERLSTEREFIARELGSALGLAGRPRNMADPTERARKAVGMRVSASITRIEKVLPGLGRHLRASIHLGRFCSYDPEQPVNWRLSPPES